MQSRAAFLATAVLLAASRLRAEPPAVPPLPVRITYRADAGCPSAEEFRGAVARRAPELADAQHGEPAREFSADVSERPDGRVQGKLEISEPSGARATRRIEGDDCHEVSEALAFIVAELGRSLRIEPDEITEAQAAVEPVPPSTPPEHPKAREAPPAKKPPEPRLHWEAGFGLDATSAPAPDFLIGPSVYVEVGRSAPPEPPFLSGRLSAHYAKSGIIHGEIGNTEIRWIALRAELCGPRLHSGYVSLGGCALFDAGEVEGKGAGSAAPTTRASLWLAPGLLARAKVTIAPALLVLSAEGGLFVPLIRSLTGAGSYSVVTLDLSNNPLEDLTGLAGFTQLGGLNLDHCSLTSGSALVDTLGTRPMVRVTLTGNELIDITPFEGLRVEQLYLNENRISDLRGFDPQTLLYLLDVSGNPIDCDEQADAIARLRVNVSSLYSPCP